MPRRAHRHSRPSTSLSQAVAIAAVSLVILLVVSGGVWMWRKGAGTAVPVSADTLCPSNTPPSAIAAVLLDLSDTLTEPQRLKVLNELTARQARIPRLGQIDVYALENADQQLIRPLLRRCNPGSDEGMNPLYQNPDLARKRWQRFSADLTSHFDALMSRPATSISPIMEGIQAVALRTFNPPQYVGLSKQLIIVSDLLQFVPEHVNHYAHIPAFEAFKKEEGGYFSGVRADLTGVHVTVLYLVRPNRQPWPQHRLFWEDYFREQNATLDTIEPVYGARQVAGQ